MPLVNEVVIGMDDKDRFNASKPKDDAQFTNYVTNPTLPALVETLFPVAKAPTNFPRTDLVTAFLKGIAGVNQPKNVVAVRNAAPEYRRSRRPPQASQNPLGVAGGDNAGFPNGRRPADDVVDLSLRVAMGALCVLTGATDTLQVGCKPCRCTGRRPRADRWRAQDRDRLQGGLPLPENAAAGQPIRRRAIMNPITPPPLAARLRRRCARRCALAPAAQRRRSAASTPPTSGNAAPPPVTSDAVLRPTSWRVVERRDDNEEPASIDGAGGDARRTTPSRTGQLTGV